MTPPRTSCVARLLVPGLIMAVALVAHRLVAASEAPLLATQVSASLLWLALAYFAIRLIDIALWQGILKARGQDIPNMVRELVAALVWLLAVCVIVGAVFGQSIAAILTASTVALGVVGFALQRPIMDAFSGIVLGIQRPFRQGDWLQIDGGLSGRVVDMNWRTVSLLGADEVTVVVPNSQLANGAVRIYSRPELFFRDEIRITLPYWVTSHQGQRILLGAVNQDEEIAALPRKSIVTIVDYTDRGVLWSLLYWCPDPARVPPIRFRVHQNILRNLFYAGIPIPAPMRDQRTLRVDRMEPEVTDINPLLSRVPLFAGLTGEELRYLSQHARTRLFLAGHPVLHQGEPGTSLFILRDGLLQVLINQADGSRLEVARIAAGQFFGERSLLLGEQRTATITPAVDSTVLEIGKHALAKLLHDRPEIATYMSEILSEREEANSRKMQGSAGHGARNDASPAQHLLQRISAFFNLGRH